MKRNLHVWCKDLEIVSNSYLSLSYKLAKKKIRDGKIVWRYQDNRGNTVITDEWELK